MFICQDLLCCQQHGSYTIFFLVYHPYPIVELSPLTGPPPPPLHEDTICMIWDLSMWVRHIVNLKSYLQDDHGVVVVGVGGGGGGCHCGFTCLAISLCLAIFPAWRCPGQPAVLQTTTHDENRVIQAI